MVEDNGLRIPPRPPSYPGATVKRTDQVNRPAHYTFSKVEPVDVIEAWGLGFLTGNVVKYLARFKHKGTPVEDLKKARWYLERAIEQMERNQSASE